jgi:hypothetical protein
MRVRLALCCAVLGLSPAGCSVIGSGAYVLAYKASHAASDLREEHRNRKWAEQAWADFRRADPNLYSADFERGFKEGFADLLYHGGSGEPPLLPPPRYRKARYQNEAGYRAIEDWFAGFRLGAAEARDGGYRRWVVGPTSMLAASGPAPGILKEPPPEPTPSPRQPDRPQEPLPPPRPALLPAPSPVTTRPVPPAVPSKPPPVTLVQARTAATAGKPAVPVVCRAEFRTDFGAWIVRCCRPDGTGIVITRISADPFADFVATVRFTRAQAPGAASRGNMVITNAQRSTTLAVDETTWEFIASYLAGYRE